MGRLKGVARRLGLARIGRPQSGGDGAVRLVGRRIYILPTRFGLAFALLLLVMLIGSINYSNSMGFVLTFLSGGVAIVSILHTYQNLCGLSLLPGRSQEAFADRPVAFALILRNEETTGRTGIVVQGDGAKPVRIDPAGGASTEVNLSFTGGDRGLFSPGVLTLSTGFPLGLFRAWSRVDVERRCVVYPAPAPRKRALPRTSSGSEHGLGAGGRGVDDFTGLRPYQPGDSPRHIHWKAVAREQTLLTKVFGGEHQEVLHLDWNALPGLNREQRLSQLCRWVLDANEEGLDFGLRLPDREIAPARGEEHRYQCLTALALFGR